ncbi:GDSL-type esterase/lipase family protein [Plantactinospora sp. ZYX-F-223]|uniref:GDSL-type esterase/lipase family protein n=1 Tax=Plantactinospora sp. ZYX-F-223 TaxID=3144103 RepID=UPI0031FC90F6
MNGGIWRRTGLIAALVLAMVLPAGGVALAAAPLPIMVVGDSITQGSSGDITWRYHLYQHLLNAGVSFDLVGDRTDLYNNITNQHGDQTYAYPFDRHHHAQWGRPVTSEKDTIQAAVSSTGAQVVLVLLGINDLIWFSHSPARVADDMRTFVSNARAANPSVTIVIGHTLSRYDIFQKVYLNQADTADLNARYDALAASMSTSASRVVTTTDPAGWDPAVHTWDGTHPNSTGEARIAAAFANALNRVGIGRSFTGPTNVTWPSAGPAVSTTSLNRAARLNWSATPGATGYLIEQRVVKPSNESTFTRLPYPVADTTWTTEGLAGAQVDYRLVPTKGLMTGQPGNHSRAVFGGVAPGHVTLNGSPGPTDNDSQLWWSSTAEATGYYIEVIDLARNPASWTRLPWAVSATSFNPGLLYPGNWYRWRIVPVNGLLEGPASVPIEIRTTGVPQYTRFFALGDSYSAGIGNQDSKADAQCGVSPNTWAYLAKAPWDPQPELLACSGATTVDVDLYQKGLIPWHAPGPTLITMTIGGNDAGFAPELTNCILLPVQCTHREPALNATVDALYNPLRLLYRDLRLRAPGADIFVAGYPQLVAPGLPCPLAINAALDDDERRMIVRLGVRLNNVIQQAAFDAGVVAFTGEVMARFAGNQHAACGNDPWINDLVFSYRESSFHPFEPGNLAYALALNDRRVLVNTNGAVRRVL